MARITGLNSTDLLTARSPRPAPNSETSDEVPVFRAPAPLLLSAALLACSPAAFLPVAQAASVAPAAAENGMVVTAQHLATRVGVQVLKDGGNAVDAAVAVGYALAVVYPAAGNLGGGGFMTVQLADGRKTFLDFREKAPWPPLPICTSTRRAMWSRA